MNQSSVTFGFLMVAFLIFIIQRGELGIYWGLLAKAPQAPSSGPTASGSGTISGSTVAKTIMQIAPMVLE